MKKLTAALTILLMLPVISGCATGRNLTSAHYLPEWENRVINLPSPSETSGGYWAYKAYMKASYGLARVILIPFAVLGNAILNAYLIPTWPFRWILRGDKRLIVWKPLFKVGEEVRSDYFSKEWNADLT